MEKREDVILALGRDRWAAHQLLFPHRHSEASPPFHAELVRDFWGRQRYSQVLGFRGCAKSTIGEEDIILAALFREFHNILIIGASETRAAERLASVSYEFDQNEQIEYLFGPQRGNVWTQTKVVTSGNVCIQAMGRDQDIRGIKHLDWRPDFIFVDDFEDKDNVQTPEGRAKTMRWFLAELMPACAPKRKVRVRATPMDAESVPMRLKNEAGWQTHTYPIEYLDKAGARQPTWPAAFPLAWIDDERANYERLGEMGVWNREYMCNAVADSDRVFRREMMRVAGVGTTPAVSRTWQACYAMVDPARTVNRSSASTGIVVWSWISNRLIVWEAEAKMLLPDEIIAAIFRINEEFRPVWIGVEADGLEQFILQPLRHEQVRRGEAVPVKPIRAPRSKLDFIRGLQPFFGSGEVIFAKPLPDLVAQLLSFPTGRIDAPNALAYALQMRPAAPIHDNFSVESIADDLVANPSRPLFLAANATGSTTTAILIQAYDGQLRILADWVREGDPGQTAHEIQQEASLAGSAYQTVRSTPRPLTYSDALKLPVEQTTTRRIPLKWIVPPRHAETYQNVGLMQAIKAIPASVSRGAAEALGLDYLRRQSSSVSRGSPALLVSEQARWTLNAFAGGYCRAVLKGGHLSENAEEGPYRLLMEGLESFCGLLANGVMDEREDDADRNWAYDKQGRRYQSAMPAR